MLSPAAPGDLPALDTLLRAAFETYAREMGRSRAAPAPGLEAELADGRVHWIGDRLGAAVLRRDSTTLVIDRIAIDPAHQGAGLGRAALAAIEAKARGEGATEIALQTAQRMTRLVALYSRAGFRVTAVGPHPRGRDDRLRVFMVKPLD